MSFYETQDICSQQNASIFTVNISDHRYSSVLGNDLKMHFANGYYYAFKQNIPREQLKAIPVSNLQNILFGKNLDKHPPNSVLPYMIYMAKLEPDHLVFFAYSNHMCVIMEYSIMSFHYGGKQAPAPGWGVKCRPCHQKIKISGVLCEKPREITTIQCQHDHFECQDKTCILFIYVCDSVVDCFDGSDEANCFHNTSYLDPDEFVMLPCILNDDCDVNVKHHVRVHSLCDGIHDDNTLPDAENICMKFQRKLYKEILKYYEPLKTNKMVSVKPSDIARLFKQENKYTCEKNNITADFVSSIKRVQDTLNMIHYTTETKQLECNDINSICMVGIIRCSSVLVELTCKDLVCPGMFKCYDHVCVPLSSVCDAAYDCKRGEDEQHCSTMICPGFLKCRGEARCIGLNEICDKRVNCLHSMDDELTCSRCTEKCRCKGYLMSCNLNNASAVININDVLYAKALVIKGLQRELFLKKLNIIGLLLINISYCELSNINISVSSSIFIFIADFSHNQLIYTQFINTGVFKRLIFLDLSFNLLNVLNYGRFISLKYLSVLYLMGNYLKKIMVEAKTSVLFMIDVSYLMYSSELTLSIYPNANLKFVVKVTDPLLCCLMQLKIECLSKKLTVNCYGLLKSHTETISLYCLSLFSTVMSLFVFAKYVIHMISNTTPGKENNYSILCISYMLANIFSSIYLAALSMADVFYVNVLIFKTSNVCTLLHAILYISLLASIVFKFLIIIFVSLRIIYPFKHQCNWMKWTGQATSIIWLTLTMTYLIHVSIQFAKEIFFDNLCSIGWCDLKIGFNILQVTIYVINYFSIVVFLVAMPWVYIFLRNQEISIIQLTNNRHYLAWAVTCKLVCKCFFDLMLTLYLVSLLTLTFASFSCKNYCSYFILYALPLKILLSSFVHLVS